jgi:hypothetical protein
MVVEVLDKIVPVQTACACLSVVGGVVIITAAWLFKVTFCF